MSLFKCENCGVVENTALCGFIYRDKDTKEILEDTRGHCVERALLCSQCNPQLKQWHGVFPREDADEKGYVSVPGSRYITLPMGQQ